MTSTTASAGGEHTLFYNSETKSLFSAGACGLGWCRNHPISKALFHLQRVDLGDNSSYGGNEPCRLFRASYYHNLAVDARGQLFTWGCGTFVDAVHSEDGTPNLDGVIPALGPRPRATMTDLGEPPRPISLTADDDAHNTKDPIVALSAGAYHSVVLTKNLGIVYTFGAGQLGQLGRPCSMDSTHTHTHTHTDSSGLPVDPKPAPVHGIDPADGKVSAIGAGFYNTFAIVGPSGRLYCSGENQNKQCGDGPRNLREMVRVGEINDPVDVVDGGYCHTLVKTVAGKVFSMGCGEEGQRGDGRLLDDDDDDNAEVAEPRKIATPVVVPRGRKAIDVAAGANHSVVLGDDGVAYTFGANDVGQCGVSSCDESNDEEGSPILSPRAVQLPGESGRVVGISAGYAHTVLTTSKNRVYVFGQNDNGQLGIGSDNVSEENGLDCEPSLLPVEVKMEEGD
eukprot:jgi/Psemu1/294343/fgenesh1_pm.15_\